jgi:hypothetical protein
MSGTHRKGFDWKEIADVLRMPQRPSSAYTQDPLPQVNERDGDVMLTTRRSLCG